MESFSFPSDFLFGTATASLQIEGGDVHNNWYRFCEQHKTKDGSHCIVAADHWNRVEEDILLMKSLHQQTYRMSLEWSRIQPEKDRFSEEAIAHYREEINTLLENGIFPLVTLHHFSNPIWFEDQGGWANPQSIDNFLVFVERVVMELGDLVQEWVTINEPNVYLEGTYSTGEFPPNKPSFLNYFRGAKHMITAHIKAYQLIHRIRSDKGFKGKTKVGAAIHFRIFDVEKDTKLAHLPRRLLDYVFHTIFLEGMIFGIFKFPIGRNHAPFGKGVYCDYLGVNYYSRDIIKFSFNPLRMFGNLTVKKDSERNDMGWEIYSHGLYRVCKKYWDLYQLPIYITENGICDAADKKRTRYIYDHLKETKALIEDGVDVQRYYYWSLMDNFEWDFGLEPRFGLIEIDYETQERRVRKSGQFYGEIARRGGISEELLKEGYL